MTTEEKTENEIQKINFSKEICLEALKEYAHSHPYEVTAVEKDRIKKLLHRLFDAEVDFIERNPEEYFEIYADEK